MQQVKILDWIVNFDYEQTSRYYDQLPSVIDSCKCDDCLNYYHTCTKVENEVMEFFKSFGIDLHRAQEIMYCGEQDKGNLYWCFFDVIGCIVEGNNPVTLTGISQANESEGISEASVYHYDLQPLMEGLKLGFSQRTSLLMDGNEQDAFCIVVNIVLPKY